MNVGNISVLFSLSGICVFIRFSRFESTRGHEKDQGTCHAPNHLRKGYFNHINSPSCKQSSSFLWTHTHTHSCDVALKDQSCKLFSVDYEFKLAFSWYAICRSNPGRPKCLLGILKCLSLHYQGFWSCLLLSWFSALFGFYMFLPHIPGQLTWLSMLV